MPVTTEPIIRTVGLTKTYPGGIEAVKGVDLEIFPGEIYGLLGPNGAGKTTTIGMLTTRVIPTSGQAWVGGVDMINHSSLAKQVIGVVPQTNTLDRAMSVADNLVFHGRYFGMRAREAKAAAAVLLEKVRLADRADAPVASLSGGMAQRLMVARAILHRPRVLFLDEPTAGLDPQSRIALWEIVRELHGEGQTVMLTTHYMEEADLLADRVAIMDHGSILALDTPDALKRSPAPRASCGCRPTATSSAWPTHLCASVAGATEATVIDGAVVLHGQRARPAPPGDRRRRAGRHHRHRPLRQRAEPGDGLHQPHREGPPRMTYSTEMSGPVTATDTPRGLATLRPARVAYPRAFAALVLRDLHVLGKSLGLFLVRTAMQPFLLMFVFTYVFPKIGQGVGGSEGSAEFTSTLVAGVVGLAIVFQGIQAVALPLVQEFGYSKEIEDRVLAPLPTSLVGVQKIVTGMLQGAVRGGHRVPRSRPSCRPPPSTCRSTGWCC